MKNKKLLTIILIVSLLLLAGMKLQVLADVSKLKCAPSNAVCPSETELLPRLKAMYLFQFNTQIFKKSLMNTRSTSRLYFVKDPDVRNGFKYNLTTSRNALVFGDGKGIIDHDTISFSLPLPRNKDANNGVGNCVGQIDQGTSLIQGFCLFIRTASLQLTTAFTGFVAKPITNISILGEQVEKSNACIPDEGCPDQNVIRQLLKPSYLFTADLRKDRTENYKIDLTIDPINKTYFEYKVFDANTNALIYGGGSGINAYRRIYFNLPVASDSGRFNDYVCNGVISASDSTITGECRTIDLDTTDQLASFYGQFTAIPIGK